MARRKIPSSANFFIAAAVLMFAVGFLHGFDQAYPGTLENSMGITGMAVAEDQAWLKQNPESPTVSSEIARQIPGSEKYPRTGFEVFLIVAAFSASVLILAGIITHKSHQIRD